MLRFNMIGAGQVGKTLAYLLTRQADFTLSCVLNRSLESAQNACDFLQQGKAVNDYHELTPADYYFLTVPDDHIAICVEKLVAANILAPQNLVIHTSGCLPSDVLNVAKSQGALIASAHPIKSFVNVMHSIKTFKGTFCSTEGDADACKQLAPWLEKIGAILFSIQSHEKPIYHAALVAASSYLVALYESNLQGLRKAGVLAPLINPILASIMRHTLEQSISFGTTQAFSGPIARGDYATVAIELEALFEWNPEIGRIYQVLGKIALQLAEQKGLAPEQVEKMTRLLAERD